MAMEKIKVNFLPTCGVRHPPIAKTSHYHNNGRLRLFESALIFRLKADKIILFPFILFSQSS
jgi:hypothetical protein